MSVARSVVRSVVRSIASSPIRGGGGGPGPVVPVDLIDATWEVSYTGTAATVAADGASVTGVPVGLSGSVSGGVLTVTGVPT